MRTKRYFWLLTCVIFMFGWDDSSLFILCFTFFGCHFFEEYVIFRGLFGQRWYLRLWGFFKVIFFRNRTFESNWNTKQICLLNFKLLYVIFLNILLFIEIPIYNYKSKSLRWKITVKYLKQTPNNVTNWSSKTHPYIVKLQFQTKPGHGKLFWLTWTLQ